ncbi:MAG: putative DNA-binding domain-containing protein [Myxococcota bacterium]
MSLAKLEATFWDTVRRASPPLDSSDFVSRGQLSATRRLGIYHHAYFARQRQVLAGLYPRLQSLLGDATFSTLAQDFVTQRPARSPVIEYIGAQFPDFLESHGEISTLFVDVARFEWARIEALLARDADSKLTVLELSSAQAERVRARLSPSARLLRIAGQALELWEGAPCPKESSETIFVAVSRVQGSITYSRLSADAGRALERTMRGEPLAHAFAEFQSVDDAAATLSLFLRLELWVGLESIDVDV